MPRVGVDLFKSTGKWYAGGNVMVKPDAMPWIVGQVEEEIAKNQRIVSTNLAEDTDFIIVVSHLPGEHYEHFYMRAYLPGQLGRRIHMGEME